MRDERDIKTIDVEELPSVSQMLDLDRLVDAKATAQVEFSELVGQIKAFAFNSKVNRIAMLKLLKQLKESGSYRGLSLTNPDGEVVTVRTWAECATTLTGFSLAKVDDDLLTLEMLGEDFMRTAQQMKLRHSDILKLRKLPEDDRAIVLQGVEVVVGDKTAIVELIDEMAGKHARVKADLEEQLEKATKRVDAVVAEETKGLTKERDALIQERDALKDLVAEPGWEKAKNQASDIHVLANNLLREVDKLTRLFPKDDPISVLLSTQIDAHLFSALTAVEAAQNRWIHARDKALPETPEWARQAIEGE